MKKLRCKICEREIKEGEPYENEGLGPVHLKCLLEWNEELTGK